MKDFRSTTRCRKFCSTFIKTKSAKEKKQHQNFHCLHRDSHVQSFALWKGEEQISATFDQSNGSVFSFAGAQRRQANLGGKQWVKTIFFLLFHFVWLQQKQTPSAHVQVISVLESETMGTGVLQENYCSIWLTESKKLTQKWVPELISQNKFMWTSLWKVLDRRRNLSSEESTSLERIFARPPTVFVLQSCTWCLHHTCMMLLWICASVFLALVHVACNELCLSPTRSVLVINLAVFLDKLTQTQNRRGS